MTRLALFKATSGALLLSLALAAGARAQTFTTLLSFDGSNGRGPYLTSPIQGFDGNLWGVTYEGGQSTVCPYDEFGCGTIYRITTGGALTTYPQLLHSHHMS
jgi:uncharacterized repeat protein (TIGR03803 family)